MHNGRKTEEVYYPDPIYDESGFQIGAAAPLADKPAKNNNQKKAAG